MNPANETSQAVGAAAPTTTADAMFARVRFVLVETSHPGNVGSVARAIKTMGFGSLVLVSPREPAVREHPDAVAMASGADDVLAGAVIVDSIEAALSGATQTIAMTARLREFGPPRVLPRDAAARGAKALGARAEDEIAFVFGNERYGLPNEVVERCAAVTHIPANPAYSSLNLAQAVQLIAYEMRLALLDRAEGTPDDGGNIGYAGEPATAEQVESMFGHLQQGLEAIGFLDPGNPRKLMTRLRRLLARAGLEREEVNIVRGIAKHMLVAVRSGTSISKPEQPGPAAPTRQEEH